MMRKPIELCNADLNNATFKNVMFFSLAEGGAMGEPGAVCFYVKSGESYHFNYVFGDVKIEKVEKLFPFLADCHFGMFGMGSKVPNGWKYVSLGMGNHLIVNDEVYPQFIEALGIDAEPSIAYMKWMDIAEDILNEN